MLVGRSDGLSGPWLRPRLANRGLDHRGEFVSCAGRHQGEAKSVLGPGGELPTEGASVPLGDCTRWCEKAEPTRSGRLWAPTEG